jgi:hypothetical protein
MVELFSAARANWPPRNSKTAVKMTANFDPVRLDVIPDLLIFLSPSKSAGVPTNRVADRMRHTRHANCVFGPD